MEKKNIVIASAALALLLPLFALADTNYKTSLSGEEEVPSVETEATGEFDLLFAEDGSEADFTLEVEEGDSVIAAHLHCAEEGENGPVIVTLFGDVLGGFDVDGTLAAFTITDANIHEAGESCTTPVTDVETLENAVEDGIIYANVHTVLHPSGEIRGQLDTSTSTDDNGTDDGDDNNGTSTDDNGTDDNNGTSTDDNGTDDGDDNNGTSTDDNGTDDGDDNTDDLRQVINELLQDIRERLEELRATLDEEFGL